MSEIVDTRGATLSEGEIRDLILGYLDDHPTAMDTLDGISEWWLLRRQIEIEVRRVSRVLAQLVLDGRLEEYHQGGVRFFRRAPREGSALPGSR